MCVLDAFCYWFSIRFEIANHSSAKKSNSFYFSRHGVHQALFGYSVCDVGARNERGLRENLGFSTLVLSCDRIKNILSSGDEFISSLWCVLEDYAKYDHCLGHTHGLHIFYIQDKRNPDHLQRKEY